MVGIVVPLLVEQSAMTDTVEVDNEVDLQALDVLIPGENSACDFTDMI